MAIVIGPDTNRYFINQNDLQVLDGEVAYADDVNKVTEKINSAFDTIESEVDSLIANQSTAKSWATVDQGVLPEPTAISYSARAYSLEAKSWATEGDGLGIKLADGTVDYSVESAKTWATRASTSETNAANSASAAATSASDAATSETNAAASAASASTNATNAANSASVAAASETNAATSASNAAASETNAAASASAAATSETNAANSASAAATSETNAANSASNAATSASNAATSETNAANSASAAATSEANAATSASDAATSASAAATSETNAANSAAAAATSEANASDSETKAYQWADMPEDTVVPGTTEYSAYHWAQKAAQVTIGKLEATSSDITVTVGPTGNYATLGEALEYLHGLYRTSYRVNPVSATVLIQSGVTLNEQINLKDVDLSWITVDSEDTSINLDVTGWASTVDPDGVSTIAYFITLDNSKCVKFNKPLQFSGGTDKCMFLLTNNSYLEYNQSAWCFNGSLVKSFRSSVVHISTALAINGILSLVPTIFVKNSKLILSSVSEEDSSDSVFISGDSSEILLNTCVINSGITLVNGCICNSKSSDITGDISVTDSDFNSDSDQFINPSFTFVGSDFDINNATITYNSSTSKPTFLYCSQQSSGTFGIGSWTISSGIIAYSNVFLSSTDSRVYINSAVSLSGFDQFLTLIEHSDVRIVCSGDITSYNKLLTANSSSLTLSVSGTITGQGTDLVDTDWVLSVDDVKLRAVDQTIYFGGIGRGGYFVRSDITLVGSTLSTSTLGDYSFLFEGSKISLVNASLVCGSSTYGMYIHSSVGSADNITVNAYTVTTYSVFVKSSTVTMQYADVTSGPYNGNTVVYAYNSHLNITSITVDAAATALYGIRGAGTACIQAYASNVIAPQSYAYMVSGGSHINRGSAAGSTTGNIALNTLTSSGVIYG